MDATEITELLEQMAEPISANRLTFPDTELVVIRPTTEVQLAAPDVLTLDAMLDLYDEAHQLEESFADGQAIWRDQAGEVFAVLVPETP